MMQLAFLTGIGWRDAALLLAATIGVYLVMSVMRLFEMGARRRDSLQPASGPGLSAWESASGPQVQTQRPRPLAPELARMLEQAKVQAELERLRSDNSRLHEVLAKVAEDVARLKAARELPPVCNDTLALAPQGMPVSAMGSPRNYRLLRHLQRRGATAGCANTQPYGFDWHDQSEDRNGRDIDSGSRAHG
jgi:hypothetical protein